MATLQDDFAAAQAAKAAVAPLQAAAAQADAALAAGLALVTSTDAQVAADVAADGPGFVGPDSTGAITVLEPSTTAPGYNAEIVQPASSLPGGVVPTPPPAPPAPTS
jgi:hypothetical protein